MSCPAGDAYYARPACAGIPMALSYSSRRFRVAASPSTLAGPACVRASDTCAGQIAPEPRACFMTRVMLPIMTIGSPAFDDGRVRQNAAMLRIPCWAWFYVDCVPHSLVYLGLVAWSLQ
jgi:hypothetical protein